MPDSEQQIISNHSRSFSMACGLLPSQVAADVRKLYAWCRTCDNAVDDASNEVDARTNLARYKEDINIIYSHGVPLCRESKWIAELVRKYQFPKQWPLDLIAGMESDIEFRAKETVNDLEHYCYQAAGVVGLMMSRLLGANDPDALRCAKSLGIAMQMTNIARDVAEDWKRGRFYLPQEWFSSNPFSQEIPNSEIIAPAIKRLLDLADRHYLQGEKGLVHLPANVRLSIRVASNVYREIGEVIRQADYQVTEQRHYVPTTKKIRLVLDALFIEFKSSVIDSLPFFRNLNHSHFGAPTMKKETLYLSIFGLSLTLIMATVLFAMVAVNPKLDIYDQLPWRYSALSGVSAAVLWWLSRRMLTKMDAVEAKAKSST